MAPVKTEYWNIRGFHQPIRFLLAYAGVEHVELRYKMGPTRQDTLFKSEWANEKYSLGLDFPNLPYYVDEDVKLTQSFAILKYLGRKHGLAPKTEKEQIRIDLMEAEALDMRSRWVQLCIFTPDFNDKRPEYVKNLPIKLKEMSDFLGENPYFAGSNITYIDFVMYELFDIHCILEPTALDAFQNLKRFHARIKALDKIAAYMKSDEFIAFPLTPPFASFGGK